MRVTRNAAAAVVVAAMLTTACGSTTKDGGGSSGTATPSAASTSGPGVTDTAIKVGILNNGTEETGAKGVTVGSAKQQAQAVIDAVNASGGIQGRKLEAVVYTFKPAATTAAAAAEDQAACARMTREDKVFAVVDNANPSPGLRSCLTKAGVMLVGTGTGFDDQDLEDTPNWYPFNGYSNTRQVNDQIDNLAKAGWFDGAKRIALITRDEPLYKRNIPTVKAALQRNNQTLADEFAISTSSNEAVQSGLQSAVLKMKQSGVTHVVLNADSGGSALLVSAAVAIPQGFFPKYALTSLEAPVVIGENVPDPKFLATLSGWGNAPLYDVSPAKRPADGPQMKACYDTMKKAGLVAKSDPERQLQLGYCDAFTFFTTVADTAGKTLNADTFAAALPKAQLPAPASIAGWDFSKHRDGVAVGGVFAFDTSCSCFAYTEYPVKTGS